MLRRAWLIGGCLALAGGPLTAQNQEWDARRMYASRTDLGRLAERLDASAASPAYSAVLRARARDRAAEIRRRLERGDFQVGDRIYLVVQRESTLTDTFTVAAGPEVVLPVVGPVPLTGVLRAEVEEHLRTQVSRYVKDPVVRTRAMVRISIVGEVTTPGFYTVPSELLLSDALMAAGGWTRDANLRDVTLRREGRVVVDPTGVEDAMTQGRTLDQLAIRAGDQISVGRRRGGLGSFEGGLRTVLILLALPATAAGIISIF